MLRIEHLTKKYGDKTAVDDLNLHIQKGVSLKLKHKSVITVLVSLLFIGAYYFFYFKAQNMITDLLTNLAVYGEKIKGSAYLLFEFGSVGVGDAKATLIMLTLVAVAFLMMWFLISKSFLQVATSTGKVSKVAYHKKDMKQESITKALLLRAFKHFTLSPGYMLNSGLGIFLIPICAVALLWKGRKIFTMLNGMFGSQDGPVAGYDHAVWSYINGYHDSTFDFFGG